MITFAYMWITEYLIPNHEWKSIWKMEEKCETVTGCERNTGKLQNDMSSESIITSEWLPFDFLLSTGKV